MSTPATRSGAAPPRAAYPIFVVRALLALTFGFALLVAGTGLSHLTTFVGLYALGTGAVTLRWVLTHHAAHDRRAALLVTVVSIATGVALLVRDPLESTVGEGVLLDVFGVVAVGFGVLRMSGRFHDDPFAGPRPRARYRYVAGPLDVLLGIAVLIADTHNSTGIRIALGVWGVVTGTFLLLDALTLRRLERSTTTAGT